MKRIDAHHHLWDLDRREQSWMTDEMATIRRSFGVDELVAEIATSSVDGTVVVQTTDDIVETEELLDIAAAAPVIVGVIGYVDIAAADVGDQLDRLLQHRAGDRLVGIRALVQYQPDPDWLTRPAVLAGLREVARRDLVFDLLIRIDQFPAAIAAASAVAAGRFVLDHLGKPAIGDHLWEPWATQLSALARRENATAKLSGLVTEANWRAWTLDDLRPYVEHALTELGPQRLMFGSDWPVCTLAASYGQVVASVDDLIHPLSAAERACIWGATATSVYRLDRGGSRRR